MSVGVVARGAGAPLANPNFRRMWMGQAISELGDGMASIALVILIHRIAGTASAVAALGILTSLPQIAMGLHAGVFVDRWDRRRVMIASDVLRAALAAGLLVAAGAGDLPWVYALAIGQAAASVFFEPARAAFLPAVVAPASLLAANSICQTTRIVSMSAGAAIAGLLLAAPGGMGLVFGIDALSFLASAALLATVRGAAPSSATPGVELDGRAGVNAELVSGLRLLFANRVLLGLLAVFSITVMGTAAISVLFVPFMVTGLGASTVAIGLARGAQMVGMVMGGAFLAGPGARIPAPALLRNGIAVLGPCLALMGLVPSWAALLPILVIVGMCSSALQAATATLLQSAVPDRARGRVESALDTLLVLLMMASMAVVGVSADRYGARHVFPVAGALVAIGGVVAWLSLRTSRAAEMTDVSRAATPDAVPSRAVEREPRTKSISLPAKESPHGAQSRIPGSRSRGDRASSEAGM